MRVRLRSSGLRQQKFRQHPQLIADVRPAPAPRWQLPQRAAIGERGRRDTHKGGRHFLGHLAAKVNLKPVLLAKLAQARNLRLQLIRRGTRRAAGFAMTVRAAHLKFSKTKKSP
ncbi:MAG: hypothetical protein QM718_04860 [Steroidobacteraceae bacterium]